MWRDTVDEPVVREAAREIIDQIGCSEDEAIATIESYAAKIGRTTAATAMLVVQGAIRFDE
jgi:hypothetical protein